MPLNLYSDIAQFQRRFTINQALDAADLSEVERVLEAASRRADNFCRRKFFAETGTRVFDGQYTGHLRIPDLAALTSIALDENTDGVFEVTLTSTDYWIEREGAVDVDAVPKTIVRLNPFTGSRTVFLPRPRLVQIVGRWGYTAAVERESVTASLADATTTQMTTSGAGALAQGQTLSVQGEDIYIAGGTASPWTVVRNVNGTQAAGHAGAPIDRYVYVPEVREAALIMAGRLWKRRETAYANVIANPIVGSYETYKAMDPDVQELLWPLVLMEAR